MDGNEVKWATLLSILQVFFLGGISEKYGKIFKKPPAYPGNNNPE
jgi:hypothetical protein